MHEGSSPAATWRTGDVRLIRARWAAARASAATTWSRRGPIGLRGLQGATGAQGIQGADWSARRDRRSGRARVSRSNGIRRPARHVGPAGAVGPPGPRARPASRGLPAHRDPMDQRAPRDLLDRLDPWASGPAGADGPAGAPRDRWTRWGCRPCRTGWAGRPSWTRRSHGTCWTCWVDGGRRRLRPRWSDWALRLPGAYSGLRNVGSGAQCGTDLLADQHVSGGKEDPGRRLHLRRFDGEPNHPSVDRFVPQCRQRVDGNRPRSPEPGRWGDDLALGLRGVHGLTDELARGLGDVLGVDARGREQLLRRSRGRHPLYGELYDARRLADFGEG